MVLTSVAQVPRGGGTGDGGGVPTVGLMALGYGCTTQETLLCPWPRFRAAVAPVKAAVFPLVQKPAMDAHARTISAALTRAGLANSIDTTGARPGLQDYTHTTWL